MTQGVAYSRQGPAGDPTFTSAGFRDDVRAFFGSGTDLQELYIQPGKLTDADWRVLAEAAKWSRANADVLVDTHWLGGDPSKREVYGFASWSPRKGIVMLRNPDEHVHKFALDVGSAFELPGGSATTYSLHSPWSEDAGTPELTAVAGSPVRPELQPFQVIVLDATPRGAGAEEGFEALFPEDGVPQGWVVRQWSDRQAPADPGVAWQVSDGVLHGSEPRGTWLVSQREYGEVIQDVDPDRFDQTVKRHDNSDAPPVTDRPRWGHIGFQEPSGDGDHVQIRNARIKGLSDDDR
jgi:hypothetical protein